MTPPSLSSSSLAQDGCQHPRGAGGARQGPRRPHQHRQQRLPPPLQMDDLLLLPRLLARRRLGLHRESYNVYEWRGRGREANKHLLLD